LRLSSYGRPFRADLEANNQPPRVREAVPFAVVDPQADIQGNFASQPLEAVLASLASSSATGTLQIGAQSKIWTDTGRIYLVMTPSSPRVADVLFGANVASVGRIGELLSPENTTPAAQALAQMSPEAAPVLGRLLHEHNLNGLFELLVPGTEDYSFTPNVTHPLGARFSEPTEDLINQAGQRLDIWREIAVRIPNTNVAFRLSPELPDRCEEKVITADEWRYLSLLDGKTSVADVITLTGSSAFRVCSALYRLALEDLIVEG
jgi:hypothetical protein